MTSNPQRHILNLMEIVAVDKDRIESLQAEIASLRRRIELQDATINRQDAQLEQYSNMLDAERAAVAQLRENIVQLRTALDAVPVQEIFRFIYGTQYDTPNDSDTDRAVIDAWLRKELSAE